MKKIKEPSIAGTFYDEDKRFLSDQIKDFKEKSKNYYQIPTRAVIVPHAGLVYSGRLAYEGISQLDKNIKNIFIFAPSHKVAFDGLALAEYEKWKTTLGTIKVNQDLCNELAETFNIPYNNDAHDKEHSIEIQLPIIQKIFKKINIVPILIGKASPNAIEDIISKYYPNKENGFIISSDLSHFLNDENARKVDSITALMLETGNIQQFRYEQACGAIGIAGLVQYANKNKYSILRIDMTNSGTTTNDKTRVVGYGSWFLYEGNKNSFIKDNCSDIIIDIVRKTLEVAFSKEKVTINYPQVLDEQGACFITLKKEGELRGCIGSILAYRPLVLDIVEHTKNAAFKDHRFKPITQDDLKDIKVSVSILSEPRKIEFDGEDDLLSKIIPNQDGIIIKEGQYQAVYLPSVWEEIPDKNEFLASLKVKAGLKPDYFSKTFEAYKFETIYIQEA